MNRQIQCPIFSPERLSYTAKRGVGKRRARSSLSSGLSIVCLYHLSIWNIQLQAVETRGVAARLYTNQRATAGGKKELSYSIFSEPAESRLGVSQGIEFDRRAI